MQKITTFFEELFAIENSQLILWIPIFIGLGAYFTILFFDNFVFTKIIFANVIFATSLLGYFFNRNSYRSLIFIAISAFLFGCIYTFIYQKTVNNYTNVTGKIFVDVKAKVADINKFSNKISHNEGLNLLLVEPEFYKSQFRKSNKNNRREQVITEKYIIKNFMNLEGFQEIDREFLDKKNNYQVVNWVEKGGRELYFKPPHKISVISQRANENLKIGDEVFFRATLMPFKPKQFVSDFDFAFNAKSKGIGAQGYVSGEIIILKKSNNSSVDEFFAKLRKKIQTIILDDLQGDQGTIAAALLMGNQNLIAKDTMTEIRNSGLVHLISISGLHLSLAAGIFFVTLRFLLSRSQYLTLRFDIKKIAAIVAIISSYFYLKIAGSPVPAVRSFVAVALVMLAIFFDRKIDGLRSIMLGAFVLILLNPYNIFSISFQLSFAAMLALVAVHELWVRLQNKLAKNLEINKKAQSLDISDSPDKNFARLPRFAIHKKIPQKLIIKVRKFCLYFAEMTLVSTAAQLATAPFIIYYFGDVSVYGALSNLIAIPLTSFTTMPLGFLSFFLMPLGIEKIALIPMGITIDWVVDISRFVSHLSYSHFYSPQMPKIGLALATFGGLIFCFCISKLKWLGALIFMVSFLTIAFVKQPDFIIDSEGKFFAIYNKKNGLVFSKDLRPSKKRDTLMQKMNEVEFKSFNDFSDESLRGAGIDCDQKKCKVNYKDKKLIFLLQRTEIAEICGEEFDVIINLTKKYALPQCDIKSGIKIDNLDLLQKGGHFLYFENDKIIAKTAR